MGSSAAGKTCRSQQELGRIEQSEPEAVRALIERITERAEARPTNADYALLLGEYYLSGNEPAEALRYYERLTRSGRHGT